MDFNKQELLNAQKERNALMRWKLILVAVIGSVSLGFSQKISLPQAELALCLIPFTCCYVDLLCRNLSIRTKMISSFFRLEGDPLEIYYEKFKTESKMSLESLALLWSTALLSLSIIPIGVIINFENNEWLSWPNLLFGFSGLSGFFLAFVIENRYQKQKKAISRVEKQALGEPAPVEQKNPNEG